MPMYWKLQNNVRFEGPKSRKAANNRVDERAQSTSADETTREGGIKACLWIPYSDSWIDRNSERSAPVRSRMNVLCRRPGLFLRSCFADRIIAIIFTYLLPRVTALPQRIQVQNLFVVKMQFSDGTIIWAKIQHWAAAGSKRHHCVD